MGLRQLDTTGSWKVNNDPIYVPDADIPADHDSIASEDSGRDESGVMHIEWLRPDVRKIQMGFALMTAPELKYMRERMQGKTFSFTFKDEGTKKTVQGYTSKISASLYMTYQGVDIYKDVRINVIEL